MKIRYPDGIPLDDLEISQRYQFEFRAQVQPLTGDLHRIDLRHGKPPTLVIMPVGARSQVAIPIHKIAKISVVDVDLNNSDYLDEGGEVGGA